MALTICRMVGLEVIKIQILSRGNGRMSDESEIQDDAYLTSGLTGDWRRRYVLDLGRLYSQFIPLSPSERIL